MINSVILLLKAITILKFISFSKSFFVLPLPLGYYWREASRDPYRSIKEFYFHIFLMLFTLGWLLRHTSGMKRVTTVWPNQDGNVDSSIWTRPCLSSPLTYWIVYENRTRMKKIRLPVHEILGTPHN